mmetsp:Transcript_21099/g.66047  ORF Transcript_21099/g.66047 Transcript_21099/m.66047 type:complete len:114 (+) Transcript_21099:556-897(+)
MSQRVKTLGDDLQYGPKLNLDGYASKGIFDYAKFFLPKTYLGHLAAMMQANGKARHGRKIPGYANWTVTVDDVLQWIGVWMYILAFPQHGGRESYFQEPGRAALARSMTSKGG